MPDLSAEHRRYEDRDQVMNNRFDSMEKDYRALAQTVIQLENMVTVVKLEQGHMKDLFSARLSVIEKSNELQLTKIDQLSHDIQTMGNDIDKTPVGRTLSTYVKSVQAQVDAHNDTLEDHAKIHANLLKWQDRVDGWLIVLKWIGAGGLVALGISILRLVKLLP